MIVRRSDWNDWLSSLTGDEQVEAAVLCFGSRDAGQLLSYFIGRTEHRGAGQRLNVTDTIAAGATGLSKEGLGVAFMDLCERGLLVSCAEWQGRYDAYVGWEKLSSTVGRPIRPLGRGSPGEPIREIFPMYELNISNQSRGK